MNHSDPVVQEVLDVWLPRFLAAGIEMGDIEAALARISIWTDWGPEWMRIGALHEEIAEEAWTDGRRFTAIAAFQTASKAYHLAYFISVDDVELHERGLRKMIECHDRVMPLERPGVEKVQIPFEDTHILGLFSRPQGIEDPPVVIVLPGLDSTKETRHSGRQGLMKRGMAVLSLEGPGQGEVSLRLPIRPDYESSAAAAIDYLTARGDVDAERIGVNGASLGGYYAARVAAHEPRVRATVANCGPYDWAECFDDLPIVTRQAFRHYSASATLEEAREKAAGLTLEGQSIAGPLYVIQGGMDPLIPVSHGERIAAMGTGEVVYNLVMDGNHGVNNLRYRAFPPANDWMARHLGATVG